MNGLLIWLSQTALSQSLGESPLLFPLFEIIHVLAISVVLGSVAIFDLRLLGWGWRGWPVRGLLLDLHPVALVGFALALASGVAMFLSQPLAYAQNPAFWVKLALLGGAGANLLLFERAFAARDALASPGAKGSAALSLALWLGVLVAGRMIGFVATG